MIVEEELCFFGLTYKQRGVRAVLRYLFSSLLCCITYGCASNDIDYLESENYDSRIKHVIIHYTSADFTESLRLLVKASDYPVSAHYLIPEGGSSSKSVPLNPLMLVQENFRAWHAGRSKWGRYSELNSSSIGIELVNESGCSRPIEQLITTDELSSSCTFLEYDPDQIQELIKLMKGISERYPDIKPVNIVGHSDVAPLRKVDPGPLFPWKQLYEAGYGIWYEQNDVNLFREMFDSQLPAVSELQKEMSVLGYPIELSGIQDLQSQMVVRSFQMRFRSDKYDGFFDPETAAILFALTKKYR